MNCFHRKITRTPSLLHVYTKTCIHKNASANYSEVVRRDTHTSRFSLVFNICSLGAANSQLFRSQRFCGNGVFFPRRIVALRGVKWAFFSGRKSPFSAKRRYLRLMACQGWNWNEVPAFCEGKQREDGFRAKFRIFRFECYYRSNGRVGE